jgi:hypothetical protein
MINRGRAKQNTREAQRYSTLSPQSGSSFKKECLASLRETSIRPLPRTMMDPHDARQNLTRRTISLCCNKSVFRDWGRSTCLSLVWYSPQSHKTSVCTESRSRHQSGGPWGSWPLRSRVIPVACSWSMRSRCSSYHRVFPYTYDTIKRMDSVIDSCRDGYALNIGGYGLRS